jgi:hypothetical protein
MLPVQARGQDPSGSFTNVWASLEVNPLIKNKIPRIRPLAILNPAITKRAGDQENPQIEA